MTVASNKAPSAAQFCTRCPNPDIVARRKDHFGKSTWEFDCEFAKELHVTGKGIVISCEALNSACCVDNGQDTFVNSQAVLSLREFFEASLRYLRLK